MLRINWFCMWFRLLFLLVTLSPSYADKIPVTIYVEASYKPFSFQENGEIKGLYNEILNIAFSRMPNYQITLRAVPWQRGKSIMEKGQGFALSPPYYHGHDWGFLYPYSLPYFEETIVVKCQKSVVKDGSMRWPKDFLDLHIGNINGYDGWGGSGYQKLKSNKDFTYTEVNSTHQLIHMLLVGRLDCILIEELAFNIEVNRVSKTYEIQKNDVLSATIVSKDHVFLGYSNVAVKRKTYPFFEDFKRKFDNHIYKMKQAGEIKDLVNKYSEMKSE